MLNMNPTQLTPSQAATLIAAIEQSGLSPAFLLGMAQLIIESNRIDPGCWEEWRPSRTHLIEMRSERSRALTSAIVSGDRAGVRRYAARVANDCYKAWELYGR